MSPGPVPQSPRTTLRSSVSLRSTSPPVPASPRPRVLVSHVFRLPSHGSSYYRSMSWDRELQGLEKAIRDLNAEYDAFLYGSAGKPPTESRTRVEKMVRHFASGEPDSAADGYRFATLQGRFNALCDRWDRLLAEKEAGKRPGLHGGFVRESRHIETP